MGVQGSNTPSSSTTADRVVLGIAALALLVGGAGDVVLSLAHVTVALVLARGLLGLAGVCLVSLLFLLVGESEDRHYQKG
jgi:hypothetical protein